MEGFDVSHNLRTHPYFSAGSLTFWRIFFEIDFAADSAAVKFLGIAPNEFVPKHMSSGAIGANSMNGFPASASSAALLSIPPQGRHNTMPTMPAWTYPGASVLPFHEPGQASAAGHRNPSNDAVLKATIDAMM